MNTREADLREALGLPCEMDETFLAQGAPRMFEQFSAVVVEDSLPPVTVVTVATEPFEVVRSRVGRRTAAEIGAYDWSADPQPYLNTWFRFGPRTESRVARRARRLTTPQQTPGGDSGVGGT